MNEDILFKPFTLEPVMKCWRKIIGCLLLNIAKIVRLNWSTDSPLSVVIC